ncbi:MAG: hypothetical protein K2K21_01075 [Lachnospiraceae bacterium]|nr:hypothetical protein [Lachnospiraceae bacterium]
MYDWIVILCIIGGAYMIYAAIAMKYKGKFIKSVVFGNGVDENAIYDKDGFVKYLYIRLLLCGVADVFIGIVCLISDFVKGPGILSVIVNFGFFISIIVYVIFVNKALRKYVNK